jgi:hypothetical protein
VTHYCSCGARLDACPFQPSTSQGTPPLAVASAANDIAVSSFAGTHRLGQRESRPATPQGDESQAARLQSVSRPALRYAPAHYDWNASMLAAIEQAERAGV